MTRAVLVLLLGAPPPADGSPPPRADPARAHPIPTPAFNPRAAAATAFSDGETAFAEQRWSDAVEAFERAQQLVAHPDTLYNLGIALHKAGRHVEAWDIFDQLAHGRESTEVREEARAKQREVEDDVTIVEVLDTGAAWACLDEDPLSRRNGRFTAVVLPGEHRVRVPGVDVVMQFERGDRRVLQLDPPRASPPTAVVTGLLAGGAGTSAVAAGFGVGAIAARRQEATRNILTVSAASTATVAAGLTIAGLVVRAKQTAPPTETPTTPCPTQTPST